MWLISSLNKYLHVYLLIRDRLISIPILLYRQKILFNKGVIMNRPDLCNDTFSFTRDGGIYGIDNLLIITNDWKDSNYNLSVEQIIDICNKVMIWFNIRRVILVANRTKMSYKGVEFWHKNHIRLKQQVTGFCDHYYVEKKDN
jgi:hypothetical protein